MKRGQQVVIHEPGYLDDGMIGVITSEPTRLACWPEALVQVIPHGECGGRYHRLDTLIPIEDGHSDAATGVA